MSFFININNLIFQHIWIYSVVYVCEVCVCNGLLLVNIATIRRFLYRNEDIYSCDVGKVDDHT